MNRKVKSDDDYFLRLNRDATSNIILRFVSSMEVVQSITGHRLDIYFSHNAYLGDGGIDGWPVDDHVIDIGDGGLLSGADGKAKVSDGEFLVLAGALFHEYAHYLHDTAGSKDMVIWPSRMGSVGNKGYAREFWNVLPHEIVAERDGISMLWSELDKIYPERVVPKGFAGAGSNDVPLADVLMTKYILARVGQGHYMFGKHDLPSGILTRDDVGKAFDAALVKSLGPNRPCPGVLDYCGCEAGKLFFTGMYPKSPYNNFANTILHPSSGEALDKALAVTAIHLHPEIRVGFPDVDFSGLTFEDVFGQSFLETSKESRARLGISGSLCDGFDLDNDGDEDSQDIEF